MTNPSQFPAVAGAPAQVPFPPVLVVDVVGVTFMKPHYPNNIHQLAQLQQQAAASQGAEGEVGVPGVLQRNPQNPYDTNAVEVHVPALGMLGHIPAKDGTAAKLAPVLDAGVQFHVEVFARILEDKPEQPGCSVRLTRVS